MIKDIEAKVTAVNLDPHIDGEKIICIYARCRVSFAWDGVFYEKEFGPIKERRDLSNLPQVGKRIRIHFNPDTGDCFTENTKLDVIKDCATVFLEFLVVVLFVVLLALVGWFLNRIFPEDVMWFIYFLILAVFSLIVSAMAVSIPLRFERQLREGLWKRIPGKYTGKYMLDEGENPDYTCPVFEYWAEGERHFLKGRVHRKKERLSAGAPIILYQNVDTGEVREGPEKSGSTCLVFLGISLLFFCASYNVWPF